MAKSVLELAVGTGQWDAGLKKAKSALDNFTQANGGLQQALDKESQKMQKFVQMMGGMESTAKTAKGKMNDYKSTIEQLTMQYNRMSESQKKTIGQDYLQVIEQMKQKYQSVVKEIQEMNRSLNNVKLPDMKDGGGGLFSGMGDKMSGALQVFAGNMLTKVAGAVANFGSEMYGMVQQGIELAKQGEGIRIAFERLGRGDILDGLRQATHGTVTDLELMKAAVKFNDFKLPLDELGTMLAFAQQKAKDTGQSVDYMVDSIVTGLGRKSLMILDNLGLSAAEIKDKMAETGDMTKAVGAIIREQMAKAGDYVETAADRAAQANVSLQNKMEELGRKFAPIEEASNQLWTSMKIGILDVVGGPLARLLNGLTEAGRMRNTLNNINAMGGEGNTLAGKHLDTLRQYSASHSTADVESLANQQVARYAELEAQEWKKYNQQKSKLNKLRSEYGSGWGVGGALEKGMETSRNRALAWRQVSAEYQAGAKQIVSPVKPVIDTSDAEQSITSLTKKLKDLQEQRKKAIAAGDTDLSKNLAKQINQVKADIKGLGGTTTTTTHKATPQERAAEKVAEAERTYAETLLKNSIRMEAGLDSTLDNKKKELSAQERLFDAYNDAYATYKDPAYKESAQQAAEKIKQLAEEVKTLTDTHEASKKAARELESAQKKLADAQQKLADAQATGSATAVYKAQKDVDKQQDVVNRLQNPSLPVPAKPTGFEAYKQSVQAEIKFDQMQVDENTLHSLLQTALKNGLDNLTVDYSGLQERIAKGIDIPDSTWETLQKEINAKLKELGIEPINIDFKTGKEVVKTANDTNKAWQAAAQAISNAGSAMQNIEDPSAQVAGIVMQAIANIALGFAQAAASRKAGAAGVFGWIAAVTAGLATMTATIASIKNATKGGFASGGIVPGNSFSGDNLHTADYGINAGELILSRSQQYAVASQLEGNSVQGGSSQPYVNAETIFLGLNNYLRREGRGEIITSKSR